MLWIGGPPTLKIPPTASRTISTSAAHNSTTNDDNLIRISYVNLSSFHLCFWNLNSGRGNGERRVISGSSHAKFDALVSHQDCLGLKSFRWNSGKICVRSENICLSLFTFISSAVCLMWPVRNSWKTWERASGGDPSPLSPSFCHNLMSIFSEIFEIGWILLFMYIYHRYVRPIRVRVNVVAEEIAEADSRSSGLRCAASWTCYSSKFSTENIFRVLIRHATPSMRDRQRKKKARNFGLQLSPDPTNNTPVLGR